MKEYFFDDIEFCEQIGEFEDEWVYDIEMNDDTHTFIANDMLVHNSVFVGFEPAINSCEWKDQIFNSEYLNSIDKPFTILTKTKFKAKFKNSNLVSAILIDKIDSVTEEKIKSANSKSDLLLIFSDFGFLSFLSKFLFIIYC
jgi:hypothetical protein